MDPVAKIVEQWLLGSARKGRRAEIAKKATQDFFREAFRSKDVIKARKHHFISEPTCDFSVGPGHLKELEKDRPRRGMLPRVVNRKRKLSCSMLKGFEHAGKGLG